MCVCHPVDREGACPGKLSSKDCLFKAGTAGTATNVSRFPSCSGLSSGHSTAGRQTVFTWKLSSVVYLFL